MTFDKVPLTLKNAETRKIWKQITEAWELDESGLVILKIALESYDRLIQAKRILDKEGVTVKTDTGQIKKHPACEIEKNARQGFLMAWRMLNLGIEPPGSIGRPPGK